MRLLRDRFLDKVKVSDETTCWIWQGARTRGDYGHIRVKGTLGWKMRRAHIVSYELFTGPVGSSNVCHSCDNTLCVNPDHLWLGTHKENSQDMVKKGRLKISRGKAKITSDDAIKIRYLYSEGVSQKDLANQFRLAKSTISLIVNNKRWVM